MNLDQKTAINTTNNLIYLETLGCSKNRVDSEIMLGVLLKNNLIITPDPEKANIIIVNTCGFIASAVKESIDRILGLSEFKNSGVCQKLIIAGCLSERYREKLMDEVPEIDGLIGTSDYTQIFSCIRDLLTGGEHKSFLENQPLYSVNNFSQDRVLSTKKHFVYLKIAEGCSNMCSFCNIPKLRGGFKSKSVAEVKTEFLSLVKSGIKEINIISQDSSSYGVDLPDKPNLYELVKELLNATNKDIWLRIFYSYPNLYPFGLFELMKADHRLVPYIDMPFQHISDNILKKMNRKITEKQILKIIESAKNVYDKIVFRTTLMVGFPSENEADFQKLLDFVDYGFFHHVGVFTYSNEDNILSSRFDEQIPEKIKKKRMDLLMKAQQKVSINKNQSMVGQIQKILIEGYSEETDLLLQGRSQYQAVEVDGVVYINEGEAEIGEFQNVEIIEAYPYDLIGKIV